MPKPIPKYGVWSFIQRDLTQAYLDAGVKPGDLVEVVGGGQALVLAPDERCNVNDDLLYMEVVISWMGIPQGKRAYWQPDAIRQVITRAS